MSDPDFVGPLHLPGEFSGVQFFPGGDYEVVLQFVDAESAMRRAGELSRSVGGQIGTTERIILTDGGDFTVFEWKHGEGVVYPPGFGEAPK